MGTGHRAGPREAAAAPLAADSQAVASYQHIFKDFNYFRYLQEFSALPGHQSRAIPAAELECQQKEAPKPSPSNAQPEAGMCQRMNQRKDAHRGPPQVAVATLAPAPQAAPALQSWAGYRAWEECFQQRRASLHGQNHFRLVLTRGKNSVLAAARLPQMDLPGWHRLDWGGIFQGFNFSAQVLLHANVHGHCFRRFPIC